MEALKTWFVIIVYITCLAVTGLYDEVIGLCNSAGLVVYNLIGWTIFIVVFIPLAVLFVVVFVITVFYVMVWYVKGLSF